MILVLIVLFVALVAVIFAAYVRPGAVPELSSNRAVPQPVQRGLFEQTSCTTELDLGEADAATHPAAALRKRAVEGDVSALRDAHNLGNNKLYLEMLELLVEQAVIRHDILRALVSEIASDNGLRANVSLAELVMNNWNTEPSERSTVEMLRIAALSDDGKTYEAAVERAVGCWRSGGLPRLSAEDLIALIESHYWVLSSEARSSGAGFGLKQRLAGVRRELTTAASTR
ncbi:MAG TPA: hypothetical protein VNS63_04595 [Blastocatellia bacterium]|nr:hypothetical protein [Blastocatellia bacterium]